MKLFIKIYCC